MTAEESATAMDKTAAHTITVCISSSPTQTQGEDSLSYPPNVKFLPSELGAIEAALSLKKTLSDQVNLEALCVGSHLDIFQLRYLLSLGFDAATILEIDTPTIKNVVDTVTAQVRNAKECSIFFGEYGYYESQLVPFMCACDLLGFLPVFGVDKIELGDDFKLKAHIELRSKVLTSPSASKMIATFKPVHFLTHSISFKDAQSVANGTKDVKVLTPVPKYMANFSTTKVADVLYERTYRAPTKIQDSPRGKDITSKMTQMLSGGHKSDGKMSVKDLNIQPSTPQEAAKEIVRLLRIWGVL